MLFEAPKPEEYKEKHYNNNSWIWRNSGIHAYNVLKAYWAGKVKHKTQEEIEKEENDKKKKEWLAKK